jgi:hypothetical protein
MLSGNGAHNRKARVEVVPQSRVLSEAAEGVQAEEHRIRFAEVLDSKTNPQPCSSHLGLLEKCKCKG